MCGPFAVEPAFLHSSAAVSERSADSTHHGQALYFSAQVLNKKQERKRVIHASVEIPAILYTSLRGSP